MTKHIVDFTFSGGRPIETARHARLFEMIRQQKHADDLLTQRHKRKFRHLLKHQTRPCQDQQDFLTQAIISLSYTAKNKAPDRSEIVTDSPPKTIARPIHP